MVKRMQREKGRENGKFSVSVICGKYLCAYFMPFYVYGFILSWCRSVALIASVVGDATDAACLRPTGALLLLIQLGRRRLRAPPARPALLPRAPTRSPRASQVLS